jgi:hypothetical protein
MLPRQARPPQPKRRMYVAFRAAGRRWVLPAEEVAGVAELGRVTPLPTADPALAGVTLHRGRAVALLAADSNGGAPPRHLIALRTRDESIALPAEELIGLEVVHGDVLPAGFDLYDLDSALESRRLDGRTATETATPAAAGSPAPDAGESAPPAPTDAAAPDARESAARAAAGGRS